MNWNGLELPNKNEEKMFEAKYKALSLKQPWAWLMCAGYKDIENRQWHLPANFTLPQRIHVHAGNKVDDEGAIWLWENKERLGIQGCMLQWTEICNTWKRGALIGEMDIVGQLTHSDNKWFFGKYGFLTANPKLYDEPIPCKGKLGFFTPELTEVSVFKLKVFPVSYEVR